VYLAETLKMDLPTTLSSGKGLFLTGDDVPVKGSVATIMEEPHIVPSNFPNADGSPGTRCRVTLKLSDGKKKIWTMNNTSYKSCVTAFGKDGEKWIGRKIALSKNKQPVQGTMRDVVYGAPA